jgi:hypothetical protein
MIIVEFLVRSSSSSSTCFANDDGGALAGWEDDAVADDLGRVIFIKSKNLQKLVWISITRLENPFERMTLHARVAGSARLTIGDPRGIFWHG